MRRRMLWRMWYMWGRTSCCIACWLLLLCGRGGMAVEALPIWQHQPQGIWYGRTVTVVGPMAQWSQVARYAAWADGWYPFLAHQLGYEVTRPLWLVFTDAADRHNGFSAQLPQPLIQVDMAPAEGLPLADATGHVARTLIHELAHHIANDRGARLGWRRVFGRVMPSDLGSTLWAYLTVPPAATAPRFWQEGFAQYLESIVQTDEVGWRGRLGDARLRSQRRSYIRQGGVPQVADWRSSYQQWPFGHMPYLWGLAYWQFLLRHPGRPQLAGNQVDNTTPNTTPNTAHNIAPNMAAWLATLNQTTPFRFWHSSQALSGQPHQHWLVPARNAMQQQALADLARLQVQPETELRWLAPSWRCAVPTWYKGSLWTTGRHDRQLPRLLQLSPTPDHRWQVAVQHRVSHLSRWQIALDGSVMWAERDRYGRLHWRWQSAHMVSKRHVISKLSWSARDVAHAAQADGSYLLARVVRHGSQQRLMLHRQWRPDAALSPGVTLPPEAVLAQAEDSVAWYPHWATWQGQPALLWVQADASGSHLMMWHDDASYLLLSRPTMIHHPRLDHHGWLWWTDDSSGVGNAYRAELTTPQDALSPVAMTHRYDHVLAAVPDPHSNQVALLIETATGAHLALLKHAKPIADLPQLPPEYADQQPNAQPNAQPHAQPTPWPHVAAAPILQLPPVPQQEITAQPYRPWQHLGLQYWTPTEAAVSSGGWGIRAWWSDPLRQVRVMTAAGVQDEHAVAAVQAATDAGNQTIGLSAERRREEFAFGHDQTAQALTIQFYRQGLSLWPGRQLALFARLQHFHSDDDHLPGSESFVYEGYHSSLGLTWSSQRRWLPPRHFARDGGIDYQLTVEHSLSGWQSVAGSARVDAAYTPLSTFSEWPLQWATSLRIAWTDAPALAQSWWTFQRGPLLGLPRGYSAESVYGPTAVAGAVALRLPLGKRQRWYVDPRLINHGSVVEVFADAVGFNTRDMDRSWRWWRSLGLEWHADWEFSDLRLQPTIGLAKRLDADRSWQTYFSLGYRW